MKKLWERIQNETAFVGTLILLAVTGLWAFDVIALTDDQFAWLNAALITIFGAEVRSNVYSKASYSELESELLSP